MPGSPFIWHKALRELVDMPDQGELYSAAEVRFILAMEAMTQKRPLWEPTLPQQAFLNRLFSEINYRRGKLAYRHRERDKARQKRLNAGRRR